MEINLTQFCSIPYIDSLSNWAAKNQPFRYVSIRKSPNSEPQWQIASIQLARTPIGLINPKGVQTVAGASIYKEDAIVSCIGEAIERYSASNYYLIDEFVDFEVDSSLGFVRCANWEPAPATFKCGGLTGVKIPHTKTLCLNTSEETYLPIETVFLTALKRDSSTLFTNPISSGLSFYTNKEVASIKGIFEVIERDALMYWWHTNLQSATEINIYNSVNKGIIDRICRILEVGLRIRLLNISRFPEIPVVLCVISGKSYPYAGFGISCNASMISAICKSIDESVSIRTMSHWVRSSEKVDCNNFDWVQELPDHMHLYANWKDSPIVEKLMQTDFPKVDAVYYTKSFSEDPCLFLKQLVGYLDTHGYKVYWKDLTLPEVRHLGVVSKIIIPKMIPLSQSQNIRWLGNLHPNPTKAIVNQYPHPFA